MKENSFNPITWSIGLFICAGALIMVAGFFNPRIKEMDGPLNLKVIYQYDNSKSISNGILGSISGLASKQGLGANVFVSLCPPKTRAVGGSCIVKSRGGFLQNFGPETNEDGGSQFVCVWSTDSNQGASAVDGSAQAVCLPDPSN